MAVAPVIYRFEGLEIDPARFELRNRAGPIPIEPQVLSVLILLVTNPERLVSRDELVEKIWNGRIISEATISARIKHARNAIGDDGLQQRLIKTVHGKGFRFIGQVRQKVEDTPSDLADPALSNAVLGEAQTDTPADAAPTREVLIRKRPSIAVIRFRIYGDLGPRTFMAEALPDELIGDLSRLRWLSVIARGTTFRFNADNCDALTIGEALGVNYCLTGSVTATGLGLRIAVELASAKDGEVIWTDAVIAANDEIEEVREEFVASIVANIDQQVPLNEAKLARGRPLSSLDAWSSYHLGIDLLFRFNRSDNDMAIKLFEQAIRLEDQFARAHAGLSFAHLQNFYHGYCKDVVSEVMRSRELAAQAMQFDSQDAFAQFSMGRSHLALGEVGESIEWIERATNTSPSYAQGYVALSMARTFAGDHQAGLDHAESALRLSPLDPMRYSMLGAAAMAQTGLGNYEAAATLSDRAARYPGMHKFTALIGAVAAQLDGQGEKAKRWLNFAMEIDPALNRQTILAPFTNDADGMQAKVDQALGELGM